MRKRTGKKGAGSLLARAAAALARALTRKSPGKSSDTKKATARGGDGAAAGRGKQARRPRREADIPLDQLANAYTPTQTSLKAPFRASGADRQRDQEYAKGFADDRWNDEDHFTNKSGDPRIGTHGRTYEPGENKG